MSEELNKLNELIQKVENIEKKLDNVTKLVTPVVVPGTDTVAEPKEWRVDTDSPIDFSLVPLGRFGVYEGGKVKVTCKAGALDSCVWFDMNNNVLANGEYTANTWDTLHRTKKVKVKAFCSKAKTPRFEKELDLFIGFKK